MSTSTFGFNNNDRHLSDRADKFKGETKRAYRLGFAWWPGIEQASFGADNLTVPEGQSETSLTPRFLRGARNWSQNVGYVLNKGPEYTDLLGEEPKTYIATVVIVWPMDPRTKMTTKELLMESDPEVLGWVFTSRNYDTLKELHVTGYPMNDNDVIATCEDGTYQRFRFSPAKGCLFKEVLKSTNPQLRRIGDMILHETRLIAPKLPRELGADLTIEQLREKLGGQVSKPAAAVASGGVVDDLLGDLLGD